MGFGVDRTGSDNGVSGIGGNEPDYDSHSSSDDHSRSDFDRLRKAATGKDVYEGQSYGDADDNNGNEKSFFEKVSDFFTRPGPSCKDRPSSMKLSELFTDPTLRHTIEPEPDPFGLIQAPKCAIDQLLDSSYTRIDQLLDPESWGPGQGVENLMDIADVATMALGFRAEKIGANVLSEFASKSRWKGPVDYSDLVDHKTVGPGKKFTQAQKANIRQRNMEVNDGVLRSDLDGTVLDAPAQSQKGVKANMNQAEVDHITARSKSGSNSYSNAQILSKEQNLLKRDN